MAIRLVAPNCWRAGTTSAAGLSWRKSQSRPGVLVCPTVGKKVANGYVYSDRLSEKALGDIADPVLEVVTGDGLTNTSAPVKNIALKGADFERRHGKKTLFSYADGHVAVAKSPMFVYPVNWGTLPATCAALPATELGSGFEKVNSHGGWHPGPTASLPILEDGWCEFSIESVYGTQLGLCEVSTTNPGWYWYSITANYYNRVGEFDVYESRGNGGGVLLQPFNRGTAAAPFFSKESRIRLEKRGTEVRYQKDGVTAYTSTLPSSRKLYLDTQVWGVPTKVYNARYCGVE
jgi:prepilin-type processing-associated H-X9-DG protein